MKDLMPVICLNFMRRGEEQYAFLFMGSHSGRGFIQNNLMSLGVQEENVSNKEDCPGPPVTL